MKEDNPFETEQEESTEMRVIIHRGSNQIGGSCIEISCGETTILLDLGKPLQDESASLPDTIGKFDAVLLSHAHEDHWGLIDLLPPEVPVYCGELGWSLIRASRLFRGLEAPTNRVIFFSAWHTFKIGDLDVTPYLMDHSSPDAYAFLIEGAGLRVFYTGDFRAHGRKAKLFHHLVRQPPSCTIDVLLVEGTTLGRAEQLYASEEAVQQEFERLLRGNAGPAFLVSSGQNLDRLVTAYKAARRSGRELVLDIYTAWVLREISSRCGNVPDLCWPGIRVLARGSTAAGHYRVLRRYPDLFGRFTRELYDTGNSVSEEELGLHPGRYLVKTSRIKSLLDRLHPNERPLVIYSMWEGYLSPEHNRQGRNELRELRERPDLDFRVVHTSGHASVKDLALLADSLAPDLLVPVHTEHPKEFEGIYTHVRLLKDGEVLLLENREVDIYERTIRQRETLERDVARILWEIDPMDARSVHELFNQQKDRFAGPEITYDLPEQEYQVEAEIIAHHLPSDTRFRRFLWVVTDQAFNGTYFTYYKLDLNGEQKVLIALQAIWNFWRKKMGRPLKRFPDKTVLPLLPPYKPEYDDKECCSPIVSDYGTITDYMDLKLFWWLKVPKLEEIIRHERPTLAVARILWETDPMGAQPAHNLMECLAIPFDSERDSKHLPEDVYWWEARPIARCLPRFRCFEDLKTFAVQVFMCSLYDDFENDPRLLTACRRIWNLWLELQGLPPEQFPDDNKVPPPFPGLYPADRTGKRDKAADRCIRKTIKRLERGAWSRDERPIDNRDERLVKVIAGLLGQEKLIFPWPTYEKWDYKSDYWRVATTIARSLPRFKSSHDLSCFTINQLDHEFGADCGQDETVHNIIREIWNFWRAIQGLPPEFVK